MRRKYKDRASIPSARLRKGYMAELMVRDAFERIGFDARISESNRGVDLTLTIGGKNLSCEVKTVTRQGTTYHIPSLSGPQRTNDFIAYVFNESVIVIEPMNRHLRKCSPCGGRTVKIPGLGYSPWCDDENESDEMPIMAEPEIEWMRAAHRAT